MTTPDQARATGRGGHNEQVAQYLRQIAGALAGADATAEGTLAAAGASRLDRGRRSIDFSPGNASFSFGSLKLDRDTVTPEVPASVTLLAADTGAAVRVADLEHAFGTWRRDVPGVDGYDTWVINLADKYRRPNVRPGRAAAVFVSASLSGDPGAPDTRVTRVLLRRDADP